MRDAKNMDETRSAVEQTVDAGDIEVAALSRRGLEDLSCERLRKTLKDLGESSSGSKTKLVDRLCELYHLDETQDDPPKAAEKKPKWSFPTVSRCPRCGVTDTEATSTQGDTQYRKCRRGTCRKAYSVKGTRV